MKKSIGLYLLFFCIAPILYAQKDVKIMMKPKMFNDLRFNLDDKKIEGDLTKRFDSSNRNDFEMDEAWLVFSDRSKNPVYKASSATGEVAGTLDIGDVLYVLEDSGPTLKVVQLSATPESNFTFKASSVKVQGWIAKNKLILWDRPLRSNNTRIELKGFLINDGGDELIKKISNKESNKELIELYDSPESNTKVKDKSLYEVLFVYNYDSDQNRYLLSPSYNISGSRDEVFWVNAYRVKVWNTRLALEWNFDEPAVKERQDNLLYRATVFSSLDKADKYRQGLIQKAEIDNRAFLQTMDPCCENELSKMVMRNNRYSGEIMRYPYFESQNSEVLKCGALLRVNPENSAVLNESDWQVIMLRWKNKIEATERVNVVFVINSRIEFSEHAAELGNLIDICQQKLEAADVKFKGNIKMGAVLFQDMKEKPPYKVFAATKDFGTLKRDLTKKQNYVPIADMDPRDLMNLGIKKALEEVCHPDETNLVIVLGSAGDCFSGKSPRKQNPVKDFAVPQAALASALVEYDAHVLAIQAFNHPKDAVASAEFGQQMSSLLRQVTNQLADEYRDVDNAVKNTSQSDPVWARSDVSNYSLDYVTKFKSTFKVYSAKESKHDLNISTIGSLIGDFVADVAKKESEVLASWNELILDDSKFSDRVVSGGSEIRDILVNFSPEERRMLALQKVQLLYNGFTPIQIKGANHPTYQFVLFMSKSDLEQLNDRIKKIIIDSSQPKQQRKAIVKAWYEYASSVLNEPVDKLQDRYKNSTDLQRVLKTGLRGFKLTDSSIFSKYDEDQINDVHYVTSEILMDYVTHLKKISEDITALIQDSNMAYRTSNGSRFYWVPIDYLP